ncbi:DGQHR domain-containing protein [Ilumatobacter fluminis]|uniref:DGQHR domain-containing protein n=1 Tax=Ilumatobacter fluminis TaxID=467091 RepID=A0A4R7HUI7_9ACTN|nr:DGQHR domain-containing protein [Ilumatobacter fluminis]TDT14601.1 DGQHR domain-containing protein [Ilumatobacter fluminis]
MTYEYPAIFTCQRGDSGPLTASFVAPAGEVAKWAEVERLSHGGGGHQRLRSESRVRAIARFLEQDNRNTIPTALVVSLRLPDIGTPQIGSCGTIRIPDDVDPRPGLVIDGQHRMYGAESFDSSTPLNVVALVNAEDEEVAFQFLVINSKASKVPTDHVKLLALHYAEDALAERLRSARMVLGRHTFVGVADSSPESPFFQAVEWPTEPSQADADRSNLVRPASIEQAFAAIDKKKIPDLADDDSLIEFFFTLWRTIKERWPELWTAESKLLQKVGLVAMTTFVIDDLIPLVDRGDVNLADPDATRVEIEANILDYLDPGFWQREWTAKSLDTSAGRQLVVDALTTVRRNMRREVDWDTGVGLLAGGDDDG